MEDTLIRAGPCLSISPSSGGSLASLHLHHTVALQSFLGFKWSPVGVDHDALSIGQVAEIGAQASWMEDSWNDAFIGQVENNGCGELRTSSKLSIGGNGPKGAAHGKMRPSVVWQMASFTNLIWTINPFNPYHLGWCSLSLFLGVSFTFEGSH